MAKTIVDYKLVVAGAFVAVLVLGLIFFTGNTGTALDVQGEATLNVNPDRAEIYLGVSIVKPTAAEAQSAVSKLITNVTAGLKNTGLTDTEISTMQYSIYPEQSYDYQTGKVTENGYRATQQLRITTANVNRVGEYVDAAAQSGANQINYVQFVLSPEKESGLKAQVLGLAAQTARAKAETLASSLGVKLIKVTKIQENAGYMPYPMYSDISPATVTGKATEISPSQITVSATVTISYLVG